MDWEYIGQVNGKCYTGHAPYTDDRISLCTVELFVKVIGGKTFYAVRNPEDSIDRNYYNVKANGNSGSITFENRKYSFGLPKFD